MNGYQLFVSFFGLLSVAVSAWGVWSVAKAEMRCKPVWNLHCLFGFIGFGINWTDPEKLILVFGVAIPPISVFKVLPTGPVIVKMLFPVIALVALGKSEFGRAGRD